MWLGEFESILKCMKTGNFDWFLHVMLFYHTQHVIRKQKKKETPHQIDVNNDDDDEGEDEDKNNDGRRRLVFVSPVLGPEKDCNWTGLRPEKTGPSVLVFDFRK